MKKTSITWYHNVESLVLVLSKFSTLIIYLLLWVNSGAFLVAFQVKNRLLFDCFWVLFGFLRVEKLRQFRAITSFTPVIIALNKFY